MLHYSMRDIKKIESADDEQHHIHTKILADELHILYDNLLLSVPANLICSSLVFISLYKINHAISVYSWFFLVILISLFRLASVFFYHKHVLNDKAYLALFIIGSIFAASLWGALDSFLMPVDHLHQVVIIVIVAGVTAGAMQSLQANLAVCFIYLFMTILPLIIWLALQGGVSYVILTIAMSLYLIFMLTASFRGYSLLRTKLELYYQNIELFDKFTTSKNELQHSYHKLEIREHEAELINKLNDALQICNTSEEAYLRIALYAAQLFPELSGALAVLGKEEKTLETVQQWGDERLIKPFFSPEDCFAIRGGNMTVIEDLTKDIPCSHYVANPSGSQICIPLIVQGNTIGSIFIYSNKARVIAKKELALTFANSIKLSLSNLKLRELLQESSIRDHLTGLFNRRYLDESLPKEIERSIRKKTKLYVAMLDLDNFKNFNDSYGHEAGDIVLKNVGSLLLRRIRATDVACRFGGEEFFIYFVDISLENVVNRLQELSSEIKNSVLIFNKNRLPPVTVSIGIAVAPEQGSNASDILLAADQALYKAKREGRDRIVVHQAPGHD